MSASWLVRNQGRTGYYWFLILHSYNKSEITAPKSVGILEIEAGIMIMHNGFERIFSSVPSHYSKGVSLANGAYGNGCVMSHGCTITQNVLTICWLSVVEGWYSINKTGIYI